MSQFGDRVLHAVTRAVHRVYPRVPVIRYWPDSRRIYERVLGPVQLPLSMRLAARHRRRLDHTTFIGIAGSAGKTMTKAMIGAVLGSRYQGTARKGSSNFLRDIATNILAAKASDQFCVIELSADGGPGCLRKPLEMLCPDIGVITNIGTDHFTAYGSQDAIAREKGRLIRSLHEDGVAVLNADDPLVISMRSDCRARVISFGLAPDADVRAVGVRSAWPDRLSFEIVYKDERVPVQTQMCGAQWVTAALGGAATGIAMGIPLPDIARSLGTVLPFVGRMSPHELPDGVTFIRDDWKASLHTIPPALDYLGAAQATRKIAVIGTVSDCPGEPRGHYVRIARRALEVADLVIFVGPSAFLSFRAQPPEEPDRLRAFSTAKAASDFLGGFLKAGDLVLLKGSNGADHLVRIALARTSVVTCWRSDCHKSVFCNSCKLVDRQPLPDAVQPRHEAAGEAAADLRSKLSPAPGERILVGLGNPGGEFAGTPHNVGYTVVDRIATEAGAEWRKIGAARCARAEWRGSMLCLVKPDVAINFSGRALHDLFGASGLSPGHALLIFDDASLPLGKVRIRMRGSDGGHRGVRSILESFQSGEFPRVKIGVRPADVPHAARDFVLRPFDESEKAVIESAVEEACAKVEEVLALSAAA